MALNIGVESIQLVLYTPVIDLSDKLKIAGMLSKAKGIKFDNSPTILPIPKDAPPEVPSIVLRSSNGSNILNISQARTDLFVNSTASIKTKEGIPGLTFESIEKETVGSILEIFNILSIHFAVKVNRVALVTKQTVKLKSSAKDYFIHHFIKGNVGNPYEIKFAYLYKERMHEFDINKWRRLDTLRNKKNMQDDTAMMLTHDINTMPGLNMEFDGKKISTYFQLAFSLIKKETVQLIK